MKLAKTKSECMEKIYAQADSLFELGFHDLSRRINSCLKSEGYSDIPYKYSAKKYSNRVISEAKKSGCMEEIYGQADYLFDLGFLEISFKLFHCLAREKSEEKGPEYFVINASLVRIAIMYLYGDGIEKNQNKAFFYFKKAARFRDSGAVINLAIFYKDDLKLYKKALYWFRFLEKNKESYLRGEATIELAKMYFQGLGVKKDDKKARNMLEKLKRDPSFCEMSEGSQEEAINLLDSINAANVEWLERKRNPSQS